MSGMRLLPGKDGEELLQENYGQKRYYRAFADAFSSGGREEPCLHDSGR